MQDGTTLLGKAQGAEHGANSWHGPWQEGSGRNPAIEQAAIQHRDFSPEMCDRHGTQLGRSCSDQEWHMVI